MRNVLIDTKPLALTSMASAAMFAALPAMATLTTPIAVSLVAAGGYVQGGSSDPAPINVTQNLTYAAPITSITPPFSSYLLGGERIDLSGDTIHIRSGAGDNTAPAPNILRTGLLGSGGVDKARYVFNGLNIAGRQITGYSISTFDISGAGAGTFSGVVAGTTFLSLLDTDSDGSLDRLIFDLEDLRFVARPGVASYNDNYADFTITLQSVAITEPPSPPAVPEPSSLMLAFAGLAGLCTAGRLRTKVTCPPPRPGTAAPGVSPDHSA